MPDMIGGDFTLEERVLLIEIAKLQNKWITGKKYLKENHSLEMNKSQERVGFSLPSLNFSKN